MRKFLPEELRVPVKTKSFVKSKKWGNLNAILQQSLGIDHVQFESFLASRSIRVNAISVDQNLYLPPSTEIVLFWRQNEYLPSLRDEKVGWNTIVHVDKDYLVTDKVASLPTIPTRDNGKQHFIDYLHRTLPRHLTTSPLLMTTRLDAGTHGLLVFARSPTFQGDFNKLFNAKKIKKLYQAVVVGWKEDIATPQTLTHYLSDSSRIDVGHPEEQLEDEHAVVVHSYSQPDRVTARVTASLVPTQTEVREAKLIILEARDVAESSLPLRPFAVDFTRQLLKEKTLKLLTIQLITGRTHQIRSQLSQLGLHIVGDWLYDCPPEWVPMPSPLALCCSSLEFVHPYTKETKRDRKSVV